MIMESRKRSPSEVHWEYYLGLEEDFLKCARYIDLSNDHMDVFSQLFTQTLISGCAEFESVSKAIASCVGFRKISGIKDVRKIYSLKEVFLWDTQLRVLRGDIEVKPFADWPENESPSWWQAYNEVKHARHTSMQFGSMKNALYSLGGCFLANIILMNNESKILHNHALQGIRMSQLFKFKSNSTFLAKHPEDYSPPYALGWTLYTHKNDLLVRLGSEEPDSI